ncbi:hypothetical protein [uncultured Cytophaga sp.]|uniref:hypothetical protein n=1 Tax=uncultured Cytophaga sp. TaxID=160238 RepID=UPI0026363D0D|nr:hypothetical protein [uncultured Cytophaga sp.]
MNTYKYLWVGLLLFFVVQIHSLAKPIVFRPVVEYSYQHDSSVVILPSFENQKSKPDKKKSQKKRKEIFIGISETTGNTIIGVLETISYIFAYFCEY